MDLAFYQSVAAELVGRLHRLSSLTPHAPSVGVYHEEILRSAIRPLLSRRFSLRTGFAYHSAERVSRQGDILIVDEYDPAPYLFQTGVFVVVNPRALACVIEVKTSLAKRNFLDALSNLYSFTQCGAALEPAFYPPTFVFAFNGASLSPATLQNWYSAVELPDQLTNYPYCVFVLNRGLLWLRPQADNREFGHYVVTGESSRKPRAQSLSLFLQAIRRSCELKAKVMQSNPFDLAVIQGLSFSTQWCRYGAGVLEPEPAA